MTAEPVSESAVQEPEPPSRWPVPPVEGWSVEDLFTLPDLPPHTELLDGSLVFVSPQRRFHSLAIDLLVNGLRGSLVPEFRVQREMTVVIDKRNGPEPDISLVRADAIDGMDQTHFQVKDVVLAIEVVSPDSEARDRDTKPRKYAAAGIRHFWLVQMSGEHNRPVVQVYERGDVTGTYALTGIHHDHLKISVPYDIDIDLTAIDNL
ncbi:Uma2 family endonuclease [Streptomyces sp. NPDC048182]|uniref:Uma2 family endonuclease n=1 Tax=Streptomyces sp. NPDC048182 TaxID=3365507 RepID=UPI00371193CB